jgi:drug/metabolite transporter (DMT)-like permease
MFGSVFSWVFYTTIIDKLRSKDMLILSRDITLFGTIFLLPFALFEVRNMRIDIVSQSDLLIAIVALIYLAIFASALAFLLWNKAIDLTGSSTITNGLYLIPPITILGDSIILGNIPNLYVLVGAVMVLAGVYLSERT